jgi:glyceraldehyde-3-phosphate dehydrogenase/erythrose-4-phosphate dehydrogenase
LDHPDVEITAINDPFIDVPSLCYLLKYDTVHGQLQVISRNHIRDLFGMDTVTKRTRKSLSSLLKDATSEHKGY